MGIRWDAGTGAVRLTMLSGSVDVSSLQAVTYYRFEQLSYAYTIPEPATPLLLADFSLSLRLVGDNDLHAPIDLTACGGLIVGYGF